MSSNSILSYLARAMLVSVCLMIVFAFQIHYLGAFNIDDRISLFYLPAAVITLSALTLRYHSVIGIFLGYTAINLTTGYKDLLSALVLSTTPAIVTAATIALLSMLSRRLDQFFSPTSTLADIDAIDILFFCAGYGLINASLHHLLFYFDPKLGAPVSLISVGQMMFGDLTGSFLGFIALNLCFSLLSRAIRQFGSDKSQI